MVKGLDVFQKHFAGYTDQFILIGGTAATLAMERAGIVTVVSRVKWPVPAQ
jgi:hypothetical protein